jgi:arginyl-tRNA synthetase
MSSRTGDVLSAEEMIESAKKYTLEIMKDREMDDLEKEETAKQIAIAGIKYLILRQASGKDVIYDAKKALSFEGDSGPYLQYTTVRARSIITKAVTAGIVAADFSFDQLKINDDGLKSANALARKVYVFPEIIERAYTDNAPHIVATYLIEIAGMFNAFYANNKIVDNTNADTSALSAQLLSLTTAVEQVLTNGLYLLGITVPERM